MRAYTDCNAGDASGGEGVENGRGRTDELMAELGRKRTGGYWLASARRRVIAHA